MSDKYNEAYLRIHNAKTMLKLIISYLEQNESEAVADTLIFAAETAMNEAEAAEWFLSGKS